MLWGNPSATTYARTNGTPASNGSAGAAATPEPAAGAAPAAEEASRIATSDASAAGRGLGIDGANDGGRMVRPRTDKRGRARESIRRPRPRSSGGALPAQRSTSQTPAASNVTEASLSQDTASAKKARPQTTARNPPTPRFNVSTSPIGRLWMA